MSSFAALTMVYKSYNFLEKWVDYYGGQFGKGNLFIVSHGEDERHAEITKGCNLITVPRDFGMNFDVSRWEFLSKFSSGLLSFYKSVLCVDCDEFVIVDPAVAPNLPAYLSRRAIQSRNVPTAPIGFHLVPTRDQLELGFEVDWKRPLTEQFSRIFLDPRYCKPCLVRSDVMFSPGGHGVYNSGVVLDRRLVLLHIKYLDMERISVLSKDLSQGIKKSQREGPKTRDISSLWRYGEKAEQAFLSTVCSKDIKVVDAPTRYAANLTKPLYAENRNGISSFLPMAPFGSAPLLELPESFKGII